jgi:hypothetical protein
MKKMPTKKTNPLPSSVRAALRKKPPSPEEVQRKVTGPSDEIQDFISGFHKALAQANENLKYLLEFERVRKFLQANWVDQGSEPLELPLPEDNQPVNLVRANGKWATVRILVYGAPYSNTEIPVLGLNKDKLEIGIYIVKHSADIKKKYLTAVNYDTSGTTYALNARLAQVLSRLGGGVGECMREIASRLPVAYPSVPSDLPNKEQGPHNDHPPVRPTNVTTAM